MGLLSRPIEDAQPNIGTIPGSLLSVVRDLGRNCLASAMPGALRPLMPRPVPVAPVFLTTAGCRDMLHACSGRDGAAAFAEIKAAPSVAAVLSLTFENFAQKPGGPVFALFQLESGPPRFLLAETEGKTSTGHEFARHAAVFFPETRMLVDNVSKRHVARSIDKLPARQLFDVFFGGPTRLRQVYIVT
jgi:hypothetical protein